MGTLLKSKTFWTAAVATVLLGLYALLGFVAAPRLIRSQAIDYVDATYGRKLQIGEVRVNPFKLQIEVRDVSLPDNDQQPMVGFHRFFADFEMASLWHRAFTFKDIALDRLAVRAVIRPDGAMNLGDLAPPKTVPQKADEAEEPLPNVWVQSFIISDGHADYIDRSRAPVFRHRFAPIAFQLKDFRTSPEGGEFGFSARNDQNAQFEWRGRFALAPQVNSQGTISIANLRATRVSEFLGDALPFGLSSGLINLAGTYDVTAGALFKLQAEMPRIEFSSLGLRARGVATDWVEIPSLLLTDTRIALPAQTVGIANITLAGTKVQLWRNTDGSTNIQQLLGAAPATEEAPSAPAVVAEAATAQASTAPAVATEATQVATATPPVPAANRAAEQSRPWQVSVTALDLHDASIDLEDRSLTPAVKFAIKPLNVGLQAVSLDLTKPLPINFDATINGKASLTGSGRLSPDPLDAEFDMLLEEFDLRDVQPYVAASTDMTITRGTLGLKGKLGLTSSGGNVPRRSFAGDVKVTDFSSIDNALEQDFFACEGLELAKVRYVTLPDALSIDRIRVVQPFNRVIVGSNQVLNVAAVFDPEGTAATIKASQEAAAAAKVVKTRKKSRAELKAEKAAKAAAAKARAAPPVAELKETGLPIRIRELSIENGRMDFADYSIQPNFAANVTDLNGHVRGMSSDPNAQAKVDIKGKVGDFSPVTIAGEVQPFAYDRHTDIGLKFENISLPIFNPYSGKFAGYNIAKGKLTTDLHYTIDERKLAASHKIRIDQLEWGEATAAKGEATLPVKFATSLLKDADGVITLDVPVKGTIDDPKFRIGPIVWQIIRNILTKAVTAPFRALGALFKDAEKAQFVDFDPGQAALDVPTTERLAGLAKTLAPKSDIRLDVPIGTWAELDRAALAEQRYDAELLGAMQRTLPGKKSDR